MDLSSTLHAVLVVCLTRLPGVSMAPLSDSKPWTHPCSNGQEGELIFTVPPPSPGSLGNRLHAIVLKYKDGLEILTTLKKSISDSVQSEAWVERAQSQPSLQGFPSLNVTSLKLQENTALEYERMASLYIFFEQAFSDGAFKSQFQKIMSKVKEVLCEFQIVFRTLGVQFESRINRTIMPDEYKGLSETKRFDRDYVIARDSAKIFAAIIPMFEAHANEVQV